MLLSAVDLEGSVCKDSIYDPWNRILPEVYGAVVDDLKKAFEVVVVRRKVARDTSERWFCVASVESSVIGEYSGQQGVRISNVVEVGELEYVPQSMPALQIPARVMVLKVLQRRNGRSVRRPLQLQSSVDLSLMRSRLCCQLTGVYFDEPKFRIFLERPVWNWFFSPKWP